LVVKTTAQVIGGPLDRACHWDAGGIGNDDKSLSARRSG
jgi:hypothetical protein